MIPFTGQGFSDGLYPSKSGIFLAFLGRGPRSLWFGNFIGVSNKLGK